MTENHKNFDNFIQEKILNWNFLLVDLLVSQYIFGQLTISELCWAKTKIYLKILICITFELLILQ